MPIAIACDSPGYGGSERDLIRMLKTVLTDEPLVFLVGRHSDVRFLEALKPLGDVYICGWAGNAVKHIVLGITVARNWANRFPNHYFLVWSHHCDSNRWLRLYLAISRRKFVIVERAVAPTPESLRSSRLTAPLMRFISRRVDLHLFCGFGQRDGFNQVFGQYNSNCRVIPNSRPVIAIRSAASQYHQQQSHIRRSLGLSSGRLLICIGRFDPNKGQHFLIRALAELEPDVNLLLVGEGPTKEELQRMANDLTPGRVKFTTTNEPVRLLAAADIFTLPTLAEGLCGALIEAMAAGLPCVTTDIPGNWELVQQQKTGLLVPAGNPSAFASAIRALLHNPAEAQRMAAAGYDHVLQRYDEANEVLLWRNLFTEING